MKKKYIGELLFGVLIAENISFNTTYKDIDV